MTYHIGETVRYVGPIPIFNGKIILIECKNERGRLRDDQKRFAAMIQRLAPKVLYGVCRSVDDAIKLIERE